MSIHPHQLTTTNQRIAMVVLILARSTAHLPSGKKTKPNRNPIPIPIPIPIPFPALHVYLDWILTNGSQQQIIEKNSMEAADVGGCGSGYFLKCFFILKYIKIKFLIIFKKLFLISTHIKTIQNH
jgi:hypothetical protein